MVTLRVTTLDLERIPQCKWPRPLPQTIRSPFSRHRRRPRRRLPVCMGIHLRRVLVSSRATLSTMMIKYAAGILTSRGDDLREAVLFWVRGTDTTKYRYTPLLQIISTTPLSRGNRKITPSLRGID